MAYNRKMRKFEGTCYIPGEQLAMMAKYYRGANLNLNLTLFEDDLATMQETLDQACWCSKLDEVDRMKMAHMKGNEWRIQHDHCRQNSKQNPGGNNPMAFPALPQRSKSTVGKVERGTSALSLYDRERALGRAREDYSEPRYRGDHFDIRNRRENYGPRNNRGYHDTPRKTDYGPIDFQQNTRRTGRNMGGTDRKYEMESETVVSSLPEIPGEIRCAVCKVETCLVCKNHLYSPICQCKCLVANAGLCNKCNQMSCEEDEQTAPENKCNKMDMSTMMLTMMMSSMFKQSQTPESVCCCKPSRDNSDSSSSDSCDGKVHKVYLYDCDGSKKNKKLKSVKPTSSSDSSSCDCCKCSGKQKKNTKKGKGHETSDEDSGESDHKRKSDKGKGNKDRKSKGREKKPDIELEPKTSKEDARKSTAENRKSTKSSKDESKKSSENMNMTTTKRKSAAVCKGSIDSRNVQFSKPEKISPSKNPESSSSESEIPRKSVGSRQKSPLNLKREDALTSDTQANVPDMEPSKHLKNDGDAENIGEESSTTFSMREFIACLPKIQSNLQNLVSKLNQMDILKNQRQYPEIDPSVVNTQRMSEFKIRQDVPLLSSHQGPPKDQLYSQGEKRESEISIGCSPCTHSNTPSPVTLKEGPKVRQPFNLPTNCQSSVNASNFGYNPPTMVNLTLDSNNIIPVTEREGIPKQAQSIFEIPPNENSNTKYIMRNSGILSFQRGNIPNIVPGGPHGVLQNHAAFRTMQGSTVQSGRAVNNGCIKGAYQGLPPSFDVRFPGGSPNIEIIELPADALGNSGSSRKDSMIHNTGNEDGETIFHSYVRESIPESSDQELTDYASFHDENFFLPSQAPSVQKAGKQQEPQTERDTNALKKNFGVSIPQKTGDPCFVAPKVSSKYPDQRRTQKAGCVPKTSSPTKFKAAPKNTLVLRNLMEGCKVRGNRRFRVVRSKNNGSGSDSQTNPGMLVLEQGVGPGKFCRSKSDSSLECSAGGRSEKISIRANSPKILDGRCETKMLASTGKKNELIPLKKKRSNSPVNESAKYSGPSLKKTSLQLKNSNLNMQSETRNGRTDYSDSILKISDAYVQRQVSCQNYIVSSVELKAVSSDGSSSEILKMVHSSNSRTNETRVSSEIPQSTAYTSEVDIIPLLPLSSTTPCSDSKAENPSSSVVEKHETWQNTPAFLRKSLVQVEQLKRAHETIRSMIKNVNDVIAHIDSDSKIGIKSKNHNKDKERQSSFVHVGNQGQMSQSLGRSQEKRPDLKNDKMEEFTKSPVHPSDKQSKEVQEMIASVNQVMNAVLTSSEQSSSAHDPQWLSETTTTPNRARRDYYVLNSESTSTAFTESLRRSLENDTSRSVPLATQHRPCDSPQRPRSTRPLKRRSWFPPPK